jgi:hypothetical protein
MTVAETNRNQASAGWTTQPSEAPATRLFTLALVLGATGALGYLLFLASGISNHPGSAPLVRAVNVAAQASAGLMYGVTALVVIFGVVVVGLSFARPEN